MVTEREEVQTIEAPEQESAGLETVIGENVLRRLGKPANLHLVRVRQVYGTKYRVNIFVRADVTTFRVAHSFFLEADEDGTVLASTPAISREY